MTTLQAIDPVNATSEVEEQSRGHHPEIISPVNETIEAEEQPLGHQQRLRWTKCERECRKEYKGDYWGFPKGPSSEKWCTQVDMSAEQCNAWCNKCGVEYGENYPFPGANNTAVTHEELTWNNICVCFINVDVN
eukprot:Nk52_evm2s2129 gene=Nk52_evmTU2s2129